MGSYNTVLRILDGRSGDTKDSSDLGFSPEKAAVLKMKAELHAALLRKAKKYTEFQGFLKSRSHGSANS
jgi:hypothetical protein